MDLDKLYAPTLRWVHTNPADIASMPDGLFQELLRVASRQACKRVHYFARERGRRFDAVSPRAFVEELGVVDRWVTSALLADRGQRGWRCFRCKSWIKKSKRCDCGWNKPAPGAQWLEKVLDGAEDGQGDRQFEATPRAYHPGGARPGGWSQVRCGGPSRPREGVNGRLPGA